MYGMQYNTHTQLGKRNADYIETLYSLCHQKSKAINSIHVTLDGLKDL